MKRSVCFNQAAMCFQIGLFSAKTFGQFCVSLAWNRNLYLANTACRLVLVLHFIRTLSRDASENRWLRGYVATCLACVVWVTSYAETEKANRTEPNKPEEPKLKLSELG